MPRTAAANRSTAWTIPVGQGPVAPAVDRLVALLFAAAAGAAVYVLWPLHADRKGFDTHTQLGMEPCSWPIQHGIPCPTCGCTTAATHLIHGDILTAFVTQPFGATLALLGILLGLHGLHCLVRGRSFVDLIVRVPFGAIVAVLGLLFVLSWGYKCLVFP